MKGRGEQAGVQQKPDERHTKQRDWKAKERPKRPLCSAVS